jgi:hypothetical protein
VQRATTVVAERPGADAPAMAPARVLYLRVGDPELAVPAGRIPDALRTQFRRADPASIDVQVKRAGEWADAERDRYRRLLSDVDTGTRDVLVRRATLDCAPLALNSGAWLQWLSGPGNADDPVTLRVLALYAQDLGAGHPRASRGSAYLTLLRGLRLSEYAAPPSRIAGDQRIADLAFYLPATLLTASRRPGEFRGELLGADLCLRTVGLLPALEIVREAVPTATDWDVVDPGRGRTSSDSTAADASRAAVAHLIATDPAAETAVGSGFAWALAALRHWSDRLHAELLAALDPAYDMAELLRLRAREGSVYHQDFQLAGRPLSEWLRDCRTDASELLRVLAQSKLVKPGRSDASPLVRGLAGERGPMFRVFSPEDLVVIRRWIDSLPPGPASAATRATPSATAWELPAPLPSWLDEDGGNEGDPEPAGLRDAYHRLLRREDTPALRRYATGYVRGWLARSRYGVNRDHPLPPHWDPEGLRPWLVEQHDKHGRQFEQSSGVPLPSREALIDSTVQLAPLTLIDGSWLQGFTDHEHASSEVGHFLFETYWDELGNGEPRLNHPLIYREVLAEMGISLPATDSAEFAHWSGFRDGSFELPVYWLSIGRYPRTFLPEVLGLNLAMELSGVGGTYRRARLALKKYGFSTRFVDIHNTIDNVATGHSAWAADAIDVFMSSIPFGPDSVAQQRTWERVRVGYRSLNPPDGFLARLAGRLGRRSGVR